MFMGMFQHTIDTKGRLSVPVKFREALTVISGEPPILTVNIDNCLALYPRRAWNTIKEKASTSTAMNTDLKRFLRFLHSRASESPLDKQGRILISPLLRKFAALEGEVYVVGVENRIEIWDPDRWAEEEVEMFASNGQIKDTIASLGM